MNNVRSIYIYLLIIYILITIPINCNLMKIESSDSHQLASDNA